MNRTDITSRAALASWLLRSPGDVATACREQTNLRPLVGVSLVAIALGTMVFGAVLGSYRGGVQILYAAVKVPVAILAALAICVPAFYAIAAVLGRPWPLRTVASLMLVSAARASLLLLAFSPAVWLGYDLGLSYHAAALAAAAAYGTAGLASLGLLLRGLGPGVGRWLTAATFAALFFGVVGQTGWVLRPYLVRPRTEEVPFVRARDSGFVEALWTSARSAMGRYDRDGAECPRCGEIHEYNPDWPDVHGDIGVQ